MDVLGFAGYSGSGKTTLIERLLPRLVASGRRVSLIKHAHHAFDVDRPGKDSWRHREAGCTEVLVASAKRWALMHELRGSAEPSLDQHLARLSPCDLVLVEGWKHAAIAKLEVHRAEVGAPLLAPADRRYRGDLPVRREALSACGWAVAPVGAQETDPAWDLPPLRRSRAAP